MRSGLITGAQLRAARGLLNLSITGVSELTGLAINTIRRAEATNEVAPITAANIKLLVDTFQKAGVLFIAADELGVGVRFASAAAIPVQPRRRDSGAGEDNSSAKT